MVAGNSARFRSASLALVANITDVAKLAGVSHQTVSRVINNEDTVRPQTRARVEAAMGELRYRPSSVARALATRKTKTIGLISTGNPLYGPSSIALAVNEAAREAGYQVATTSMGKATRATILAAVDILLRQQVEALVIVATERQTIEAINDLDLDVPLVTADSSGLTVAPSVSIDQVNGARVATAYLADLGHREILHVAGPPDSIDAVDRERGWRAELERRGLAVHEPLSGDWTANRGQEIGEELADLLGTRAYSAVFVANDQMALGILHAFTDRGIRVPQDVSLIGFDDIPEAAHFTPPLTTIRQDFRELGQRIVRTVVSGLAGNEVEHTETTQPHLIERASTIRHA